jgi:hypothetical protein
MTAKTAIKLRCKDCNPDSRDCGREDCLLYGLHRPKAGANRTKAIREYCTWCLNGHKFGMCSSPDCSIFKYRTEVRSRVPKPRIDDELEGSTEETE